MSAIKPETLAKYIGFLYARPAGSTDVYKRLSSIRWLVSTIDASKIAEVITDDNWVVLNVTRPITTIECELLENMGRDTLAFLFSWTSTNVAWTPVTWAVQSIWAGFAYSTAYEIQNQNANNALISVSSVIGSVDWPLVVEDDYEVVIVNWVSSIVIKDSTTVTTTNQTITITYDYTPATSENFVIENKSTEVKNFDVKIVAPDSTWREITVRVTNAKFMSPYNMSFLDVFQAGDLKWATITFESNVGSQTLVNNEILS